MLFSQWGFNRPEYLTITRIADVPPFFHAIHAAPLVRRPASSGSWITRSGNRYNRLCLSVVDVSACVWCRKDGTATLDLLSLWLSGLIWHIDEQTNVWSYSETFTYDFLQSSKPEETFFYFNNKHCKTFENPNFVHKQHLAHRQQIKDHFMFYIVHLLLYKNLASTRCETHIFMSVTSHIHASSASSQNACYWMFQKYSLKHELLHAHMCPPPAFQISLCRGMYDAWRGTLSTQLCC